MKNVSKLKQLLPIIVVASAFFLPLRSFAVVAPNQVVSSSIAPADGTSGQTLTSGNGVKTGHIQNDAITSGKIANGAVTASKLGITCSDGYYLQYTTVGGWICSIGTAGPAGPQGQTGATGPQGPDGPQGPAGAMPHYAHVAVVAKSGGDYADPATAMNDLATWCGSTPCLLKIMPGIYDIGPASISMSSGVDIEGSGQLSTKITGTITTNPISGVVNARYVSNAELRNLTIENNSGSTATLQSAIYSEYASLKIANVTAIASNAGAESYAIYNYFSSPIISNVSVIASNAGQNTVGIFNRQSSPVLSNVSINSSSSSGSAYGIWNYGNADNTASISILNATITTPNGLAINNFNTPLSIMGSILPGGIQNSGISNVKIDHSVMGGITNQSPASVYVGNTRVDGVANSGTIKCLGVYDSNYDPVICQ